MMKIGEPDHESVIRVVRPRNRYGDALPGTPVRIESNDLQGTPKTNPVLAATMSLEEWQAAEEQRNAPKPEKPIGRVAEMVRTHLASEAARVRSMIEAGKARIARTAERAQETAREMLQSEPAEETVQVPRAEFEKLMVEIASLRQLAAAAAG
jgi:hypothetical protein